MKLCTRCGENKSLGEFYFDIRYKDERRSVCKKCCREEGRIKYKKHSSKYLQSGKKYRMSARGKMVQKKYRQENKVKRNLVVDKIKRPYRYICTDRKCSVCGFSEVVHIHHKDGNHKNNHPSNLVALCPNHHAVQHLSFKKNK